MPGLKNFEARNAHCSSVLVHAIKGEHKTNKEQDTPPFFCHTMEILNDAGEKSVHLSGDFAKKPSYC